MILQKDTYMFRVWILVQVFQATSVEGAGPAYNTMHLIPLKTSITINNEYDHMIEILKKS